MKTFNNNSKVKVLTNGISNENDKNKKYEN